MIVNGIPQLAIVVEGIIGLFMLFLAYRGIVRYNQKKSRITYYLTLAFFSFAFAAIGSAIGKYLDYTSDVLREVTSYTDFTIVLAYCLITLGNIFYTVILKELYYEDDNQLPLFLHIMNSIIIGLLLSRLSLDFGIYDQILPFLIVFILLSLVIHGSFFRNSLREASKQESPVAKRGFQLIGLFSLMFIMVIIFFIIDLIVGIITGGGFTVYYYLGWICVGLSTMFGFLGFIMPEWFRNLIS